MIEWNLFSSGDKKCIKMHNDGFKWPSQQFDLCDLEKYVNVFQHFSQHWWYTLPSFMILTSIFALIPTTNKQCRGWLCESRSPISWLTLTSFLVKQYANFDEISFSICEDTTDLLWNLRIPDKFLNLNLPPFHKLSTNQGHLHKSLVCIAPRNLHTHIGWI